MRIYKKAQKGSKLELPKNHVQAHVQVHLKIPPTKDLSLSN